MLEEITANEEKSDIIDNTKDVFSKESDTQQDTFVTGDTSHTEVSTSKQDNTTVNEEPPVTLLPDIDLTIMSTTMIYSEVYNMMMYPDNYIGKVIKIKGIYSEYHDEVTNNTYYTCIVQDATACCAQGMEFVLTDRYLYPEDYPSINEEICIIGTFNTYFEGELKYCNLINAELINTK